MKQTHRTEATTDCDKDQHRSDVSSQYKELLDIIAEIIALDIFKKMQKEQEEKSNA